MPALNFKPKILFIFFFTLPYVDLLTSLSTRFIDFPITIGIVVKGLSLAISMIYVFFYSQNKYRKHTFIYIGLICIFALIYFLTKPDIWLLSSLLTEVIYAFKYLYFPIMLPCLYIIFHDFKVHVQPLKKIVLINCFAYCILLLIPYFTNTGFPSYSWNFDGNTGWFYAANEISAILAVLAISIFDLMDNNKKWKLIFSIPIIYAVSTIGTKVSYLGIIFSVLVVVLIFVLNNKSDNNFVLPAQLLTILLVCCISSVAVENMGTLSGMDVLPPSTEDVTQVPSTEYEEPEVIIPQTTIDMIRNSPLLNALNKITSNRLLYFMENLKPYTTNGVMTLLFGLGWAPRNNIDYTYYKQLIEIDILDILIHYGIIGFLVYFLPFVFLAYKFVYKFKAIHIQSYLYILGALLGCGISCIAGHVLSAPSVSIYLILLLLIAIRQTEINTQKNQV